MLARTALRGGVLKVVAGTLGLGCLAAGALAACGARDPIEGPSDAAASGTSITGSIGGRSLSVTNALAWVTPSSTIDGVVTVFLSDAEVT
jgi:hypothetical protein